MNLIREKIAAVAATNPAAFAALRDAQFRRALAIGATEAKAAQADLDAAEEEVARLVGALDRALTAVNKATDAEYAVRAAKVAAAHARRDAQIALQQAGLA